MKPKISVIIPVYNMEKYLSCALDSVFSQTMTDVEIICINDGSTDSSHKILDDYESVHKNIKVIHQKNSGVGYSRNVGINSATGEFIAFLDPDDYLYTNQTYDLLYENAKKYNVNICGGSIIHDWNDGEHFRTEFDGNEQKLAFTEEGLYDFRDYQFDYAFYRFIYNREFLIQNQIYFPEYVHFQDPPFFVRAMIKAVRFYAIPHPTYCYRLGHKSFDLTENRICDMVRGITDNLRMSSDADLKELHAMTLYRLNYDYRGWICEGFRKHSVLLMELLSKAQDAIRKDWLSDSVCKSVYDGLFENYDEQIRIGIDARNNEEKSREKLWKTEQELAQTQSTLESLQQERDDILKSTSWKLGSAITLVPGTIKRKLRRNS